MTLFSKTSLLAVLGTLALAPLDVSAMDREEGEDSRRPMSPFVTAAPEFNATEEQVEAIGRILQRGTPQEKAAALASLMEIVQSPACPVTLCADIGRDLLVWQETAEEKAQGFSIFLALLKNPVTSLEERTDAIGRVALCGTNEQKAEVLPFFTAIAQDPVSSKTKCLEIVESLLGWEATEEQKQTLCSIVLDFLPSLTINPEDHFKAVTIIAENGTDAQKAQILPLLLPVMQDTTMDLEHRVQAANHVFASGTEEQKTGAASFLMTIAADSTAPAEIRSRAAETVFLHQQTAEAKIEILFLQVSDASFAALRHFTLCTPRDAIAISPALRAFLLAHGSELYAGDYFTFIPPEAREDLVYTLAAQPQDQWQATTARVIRQYHRARLEPEQFDALVGLVQMMYFGTLQAGTGVAHEVHNYARSVEDPVMAAVDQRLQGVPMASYNQARRAVATWITQNETDQLKANTKVDEGLDMPEDRDLLARVYTFVLTQHPDKMEVFLRGFVAESMAAYNGSGDVTSCPKGIRERVFTGLRGMDPALDALFLAPETALTAQTFVTQCNFGASDNALQWMVKKLQVLGVTDQTTAEDAAVIFKDYAVDHLKSLPLAPEDLKKHMDQLEAMADVLAEFYEDKIKPHMTPAQAAVDPKEQMRDARLKRFGKE